MNLGFHRGKKKKIQKSVIYDVINSSEKKYNNIQPATNIIVKSLS